MNKFVILLATIIALGAMLVIPNGLTTHIAKASTCSSSTNRGLSISTTTSTSCSASSATSRSTGVVIVGFNHGAKSSCTSAASTSKPGFGFLSRQSSNSNVVSCSSHVPR